jgi:ATP-binding cassette, subfamily B, bacterial
MAERTQAAVESDSAFTTTVQRSMVAIVLTQSFGREDAEFHEFTKTAQRCVSAWFGIHRQEIAYGLIVAFILGISVSLILGYGGVLVYRRQLSPGELMIYMTYLAMIYDPLCQITGVDFNVQSGLVRAQRVFEILDRKIAVSDSPEALSLPVKPRRLVLENVGFEYVHDHPVLKSINLVIEAGQSVAFVGASGTGKTTLLNLLPRFYDPTVGTIKLGEWDLRQIRLKDARRHIAMVLQDAVMLPTTIAENIAYGRPEADQREIEEVALLAGMSDFIEGQSDRYQTKLTDGGANLSGGQRQRIALARALLTEAPILLLDEPTTALDAQHEEILQETLKSLKGKRTVIIVSHRTSTIMNCDLICVLADGRIVEQGTHSELLRLGRYYASMAMRRPAQNGTDGHQNGHTNGSLITPGEAIET